MPKLNSGLNSSTKKGKTESSSLLPAVGIDFGSSSICVSVVRQGKLEVIPNAAHKYVTPNVVTFITAQDTVFGQTAKDLLHANLKSSICGINTLLGKTPDEIWSTQLDESISILEDASGNPEILLGNDEWKRTLTIDEILMLWFEHIKTAVNSYLGASVTIGIDAVLTIPAQFDTNSRRQLIMAAKWANFNVLDVVTGAVAAAIVYTSLSQIDFGQFPSKTELPNEQNLVVIDIGHTSCDVAVLNIDESILRVESSVTYSNIENKLWDHFGGRVFEDNLLQYVLQVFKNRHSKNASEDPVAVAKLQLACESAKLELSTSTEATIQVNISLENEEVDFSTTVTRGQFEQLNNYFVHIHGLLEEALRDAQLERTEIQNYILVGGSSVIPKIQEVVQQFFERTHPTQPLFPDQVSSCGAAIRAAMIRPSEVELGINLELLVLDRTPASLGVETVGGHASHIVPRNTIYPTRKSVIFKTYKRSQSGIFLKIYEGEMTTAKDNKLIGKFGLKFPPIKKSQVDDVRQVEVTFDIDTRRKLKVSVTDKITGTTKSIDISSQNCDSFFDDNMEAEIEKYLLSSIGL